MIHLEKKERIYLIKRRHPIVVHLQIFPFIFFFSALIAAFLFCLFVPSFSWPEWIVKIYPQVFSFNLRYVILFFISLGLILFWNLIWFIILEYYLNCFIVTNLRIIQIRMKGIFNLSFSSIFYDKIQDITITIKGFLGAMFRFGDIQIQTAGELGQFVWHQIPEPEIVKQVILEAQRDYLEKKP